MLGFLARSGPLIFFCFHIFAISNQLIEQNDTPILIPAMTSEEMFFQETTVPLFQKAYRDALSKNMVQHFHTQKVKHFLKEDSEKYAVFCGRRDTQNT